MTRVKLVNNGSGWFEDSRRHSLARQGIKTGRKITDTRSFANWAKHTRNKILVGLRKSNEKGKALWEKEKELYPAQKAWAKKETDIVAEKLGQAYQWEKERLPEQGKFLKEIIMIPKEESKFTTDKNNMDITKEVVTPEQLEAIERKDGDIPETLRPYIRKSMGGLGIINNYEEIPSVFRTKEILEEIDKHFIKSNIDGMLYPRKEQIMGVEETKSKFAPDWDRNIFDY